MVLAASWFNTDVKELIDDATLIGADPAQTRRMDSPSTAGQELCTIALMVFTSI